VEEQFYLLWPLALLFAPRQKLLITAACLVPGAILYRWMAHRFGLAEITMWVLPPDSMDALLLGALIAISVKEGRLTSRHGLCLALALGGFVIWFVSIFHSQAGDILSCASQTGCALFLGWVVLRASESGSGLPWRILQNSILTYIGKISYGIYVIHNLVAFAFRKKTQSLFSAVPDPFVQIAVALVLVTISIALAAIMWHLLETPINRYRRSFTYRQ
jgi:peptidoglycan/LPS O-acetylase OafA/YrhL